MSKPKDWVGIAMHIITIGLLSWFIFGALYLLSLLLGVM